MPIIASKRPQSRLRQIGTGSKCLEIGQNNPVPVCPNCPVPVCPTVLHVPKCPDFRFRSVQRCKTHSTQKRTDIPCVFVLGCDLSRQLAVCTDEASIRRIMRGRAFSVTHSGTTTTFSIVLSEGSSYIRSSKMSSTMERSPRAPVLSLIAFPRLRAAPQARIPAPRRPA